MSEAFIGVDVGTGSARAGAFAADGRLVASARRPIMLWREPGDVVEQSADDVWRATTDAVREVVQASGLRREAFAGIGFAATCSLVALDAGLSPLSMNRADLAGRDIMAWMDHRAASDAERINGAGHEALRYVGGALSPEMQTPKLIWLKREKPATFARAAHFLGLADYLGFRATGSLARSLCSVACKFNYLSHERRWPQAFFDSVGLGELAADGFARLGAEVLPPGAPLGSGLVAEAASAMGLKQGVAVGAGLVDAHAGAAASLAAGAGGKPGDPLTRVALILGTSSSCLAVSEEPRFIDSVWGPHLSGLMPDKWLMDGGQSAFGAAIDRLMRLHPGSAELQGAGYAVLERAIAQRAGGFSAAAFLAEGVHALPSFIGERAPYADAAARGGVVGLDLSQDEESLEALYVAGLCGLAYGLADILDAYARAGYAFEMIVASGGAAESRLVRQIIADASGLPVASPDTPEPVLLGSAMIGAAASGRASLTSAMATMSAIGEIAAPAGGAVAAFHARKRRAGAILTRAERAARHAMRAAEWPELVIFDCDGVLVDSEPIALGVTRRMLAEAGIALSDEETRAHFLGMRADSALKSVEEEFGRSLPNDFSAKVAQEILVAFERGLKGVEGVREAVGNLQARVCVASSSAPERVRLSLKVADYETLFAPNIFSSAEVERGKPHPDLFLYAARAMRAAPADCLVIEDSVAGVTAARAAGMTVFGFVGASPLSEGPPGAELTAAGAALIFESMARLPELIAGWRPPGMTRGG